MTASSALAVAYGVLGVGGALLFLSGGSPSAFLFLPFDVWFLVIMSVGLGVGAVFALAGVAALRGNALARWTLVGVYGLTGYAALTAASFSLWPRLLGLVNVLALVGLVTPQARGWFEE